MPVHPVPMTHSGFGVSMWVLAALGGICIPLAFVVSGLLILIAVVLLVTALGLNVADDRVLDRQATRRAEEWSAHTPPCPTCGTVLAFNPAASRWFRPKERTYVGPPAAQAPTPGP